MYNEIKYGFETRKKLTVMKAYPDDVGTIVGLYSAVCGGNRRKQQDLVRMNWDKELKKEINDFNNCSFIIRDNCQKAIGLITFETEDNMEFDIYLWFPNTSKRLKWQQHVCDSLLEFADEYTDIRKIRKVVSIESFKLQQAEVLIKNYCCA